MLIKWQTAPKQAASMPQTTTCRLDDDTAGMPNAVVMQGHTRSSELLVGYSRPIALADCFDNKLRASGQKSQSSVCQSEDTLICFHAIITT